MTPVVQDAHTYSGCGPIRAAFYQPGHSKEFESQYLGPEIGVGEYA
jgi:hypothetical protein